MSTSPNTHSSKRSAASSFRAGLSFTPRDLWSMFRERWLIGLLVGTAAAAALFFLEPRKEPLFSSEVTLLFEPRAERILGFQGVVDTGVRNASELGIHLDYLRSQT